MLLCRGGKAHAPTSGFCVYLDAFRASLKTFRLLPKKAPSVLLWLEQSLKTEPSGTAATLVSPESH